MDDPKIPKGLPLAVYCVIVPHLSVDEYLVKADSVDGAIKKWRDAEPPLEPDRTHTPSPGPRPRAELVKEPLSVITPPTHKCGMCGSALVVPGTAKEGRPVMVCTVCNAVGVGEKPARA